MTRAASRRALSTMLEDEAARTAMGKRARAAIQQGLDLHANLDRLAAALENELDEFRVAPDRRTAPPAQNPSVPVMFLMDAIRTGGEGDGTRHPRALP